MSLWNKDVRPMLLGEVEEVFDQWKDPGRKERNSFIYSRWTAGHMDTGNAAKSGLSSDRRDKTNIRNKNNGGKSRCQRQFEY